jgi:hypothetical protein
MIRQYLALQDQVDAMNAQIYQVCCDVETLNVQIKALKEEVKKAAGKNGKPANGAHKTAPDPANKNAAGK